MTLSPGRSNIEDIIHFMRDNGVPMEQYECGIVSNRYREQIIREQLQAQNALQALNPGPQQATVMTCLVR